MYITVPFRTQIYDVGLELYLEALEFLVLLIQPRCGYTGGIVLNTASAIEISALQPPYETNYYYKVLSSKAQRLQEGRTQTTARRPKLSYSSNRTKVEHIAPRLGPKRNHEL